MSARLTELWRDFQYASDAVLRARKDGTTAEDLRKLEDQVEHLLVAWRAEYDRLVAQQGQPSHDWLLVTDAATQKPLLTTKPNPSTFLSEDHYQYVCSKCGERASLAVGSFVRQPPARACARR